MGLDWREMPRWSPLRWVLFRLFLLRGDIELWAWDRGWAALHQWAWGHSSPCPCDRSGRPGPLAGRWSSPLAIETLGKLAREWAADEKAKRGKPPLLLLALVLAGCATVRYPAPDTRPHACGPECPAVVPLDVLQRDGKPGFSDCQMAKQADATPALYCWRTKR